jgi:hypothetical protein
MNKPDSYFRLRHVVLSVLGSLGVHRDRDGPEVHMASAVLFIAVYIVAAPMALVIRAVAFSRGWGSTEQQKLQKSGERQRKQQQREVSGSSSEALLRNQQEREASDSSSEELPFEGCLTRVVLTLRAHSSERVFLRRNDVSALVDKFTETNAASFSPRLKRRLKAIDSGGDTGSNNSFQREKIRYSVDSTASTVAVEDDLDDGTSSDESTPQLRRRSTGRNSSDSHTPLTQHQTQSKTRKRISFGAPRPSLSAQEDFWS